MSAHVDIAVVGAGIVGCAVAWECSRHGARVTLLEAGEPGRQASGAAAGMLAPASEARGPGPFLGLGLRSLEMWPAFAAGVFEATGRDCGLRLDGLLRIAADADDAAELRDRIGWQREWGVEARWLLPEVVRILERACAGAPHGATFYPAEGHVDSPATVAALVRALESAGVELRFGTRAVGLSREGALQVSAGDDVVAGTVVVAAGSWSGELATALGTRPLPVRPVRGQLLAVSGLTPVPRRVLFGGLHGYAVGKPDGSVLVGATEEEAGFDASPTGAATEHLRAVAAWILGEAAAGAKVTTWAGLRPRTPDGLPVLGELAAATGSFPRVLIASGHYRNGVLLAPVTAVGIAGLALEGVLPSGWEPFVPERFG